MVIRMFALLPPPQLPLLSVDMHTVATYRCAVTDSFYYTGGAIFERPTHYSYHLPTLVNLCPLVNLLATTCITSYFTTDLIWTI